MPSIKDMLEKGLARYKKQADGKPIKFPMPADDNIDRRSTPARGATKSPYDKVKKKKKRKMAKESRKRNRWAKVM